MLCFNNNKSLVNCQFSRWILSHHLKDFVQFFNSTQDENTCKISVTKEFLERMQSFDKKLINQWYFWRVLGSIVRIPEEFILVHPFSTIWHKYRNKIQLRLNRPLLMTQSSYKRHKEFYGGTIIGLDLVSNKSEEHETFSSTSTWKMTHLKLGIY